MGGLVVLRLIPLTLMIYENRKDCKYNAVTMFNITEKKFQYLRVNEFMKLIDSIRRGNNDIKIEKYDVNSLSSYNSIKNTIGFASYGEAVYGHPVAVLMSSDESAVEKLLLHSNGSIVPMKHILDSEVYKDKVVTIEIGCEHQHDMTEFNINYIKNVKVSASPYVIGNGFALNSGVNIRNLMLPDGVEAATIVYGPGSDIKMLSIGNFHGSCTRIERTSAEKELDCIYFRDSIYYMYGNIRGLKAKNIRYSKNIGFLDAYCKYDDLYTGDTFDTGDGCMIFKGLARTTAATCKFKNIIIGSNCICIGVNSFLGVREIRSLTIKSKLCVINCFSFGDLSQLTQFMIRRDADIVINDKMLSDRLSSGKCKIIYI